jgi:hypothetical protein
VDPESAFEIINAMKAQAEAEKNGVQDVNYVAAQPVAPAQPATMSVQPSTTPNQPVARPQTYQEYLAATKNNMVMTPVAQPQAAPAPAAAPKTSRTKSTKTPQSKFEKYGDRAIGNIIGGASSSIGRKIGNSLIKNLFK